MYRLRSDGIRIAAVHAAHKRMLFAAPRMHVHIRMLIRIRLASPQVNTRLYVSTSSQAIQPQPQRRIGEARLQFVLTMADVQSNINAKLLFSLAEDEKLIESVSKYPCLFDLGHSSCKNQTTKDNSWKEVAAYLKRTGKIILYIIIIL